MQFNTFFTIISVKEYRKTIKYFPVVCHDNNLIHDLDPDKMKKTDALTNSEIMYANLHFHSNLNMPI